MTETYERNLAKIIDQGMSETAGKVFRWVATVKRPLFLEEIREALAITPGQQYMEPERLLNDVSRITSWCRNLIILDEEDHSIRFAHHSTMRFFLHSHCNPLLNEFHIDVPEFDQHVGSVCVTYLNLSDFEKQLSTTATRGVEFESIDVLKASLVSNPDSAFARSIFKLDKFWRFKSAQKFDLSSLYSYAKEDHKHTMIRKFQSQFAFLAYAREYWLAHSSEFTPDTATWNLWKNLVDSKNSMAERPWTMTEWKNHSRGISRWIVENNHSALLRVWLSDLPVREQSYIGDSIVSESPLGKSFFNHSTSNYSDEKRILQFALAVAVRNDDLNTIRDLASSCAFRHKAWEVECEELVKAAAIGHSQIVEILLQNGANKESCDARGNTAAHLAAVGGHNEALQILHRYGAWLLAPNLDGRTPIDLARRFCDVRTIDAIIPKKYPGWGEWCGYVDEERGPLPNEINRGARTR